MCEKKKNEQGGVCVCAGGGGGGRRDGSIALEYKMLEFRVKRKRQQCKNRER